MGPIDKITEINLNLQDNQGSLSIQIMTEILPEQSYTMKIEQIHDWENLWQIENYLFCIVQKKSLIL